MNIDASSLIALALAAIFVLIWAGHIYSKRRSEAFYEFSRRMGLSFSKMPEINVEDEFRDLPLFSEGTEKQTSNLIREEKDGGHLMLFDFSYKTGQGKSSTTNIQTVLAVQSGKISVPSFELYPKNLFNRTISLAGKQGLSFNSETEFFKTYELRGDDDRAVKTAFSDLVLSYFANHKGLNVEGSGQRLLIYRYRSMIKPDKLQSFINEGMEIVRVFEK